MTLDEASAFYSRSLLYLGNAEKMMLNGKLEKASEFYWGCVSQMLKAVAALKDVRLRSHGDVRGYAKEIAKELGEDGETWWRDFRSVENLHSNFYEGDFDRDDIIEGSGAVERVLRSLGQATRRAGLTS